VRVEIVGHRLGFPKDIVEDHRVPVASLTAATALMLPTAATALTRRLASLVSGIEASSSMPATKIDVAD